MMTLGMFVFAMDTLPYQQLQHRAGWRLPGNSRVGQRKSVQFLGPDDETVTLSGVLVPELTGGDTALSMVRLMADQGRAWPLIDGGGEIWGFYMIESLEAGRTLFHSDGKARRIEFTLSLRRVDGDSLSDMLGQITGQLSAMVPGLQGWLP